MGKRKLVSIFILIGMVCMLFCCFLIDDKGKSDKSTQENNTSFEEMEFDVSLENNNLKHEVEVLEISQIDRELGQHQFPLEMESSFFWNGEVFIHSNQTAIEVGNRILEKYQEIGKMPDFSLTQVIHYQTDNLWCFIYSVDLGDAEANKWYDGSVAYYVIAGDTGKILDAWIEE